MAANYVLLGKVTVGSGGTTSVTFSSIPQTGYTDLVVRISCRTARTGSANAGLMVKLNNSTTGYSSIDATYDGGSVASYSNLFNAGYVINTAGAAVDASVFTNQEIYIPNYASANYKTFSSQSIVENTGTGARNEMMATTWANTAAITSIVFGEYAGNSIDQHSTFYLYGIAKLNTTPTILPYATGGDIITTDGTYWYHTFISSGTFTPQKTITCDYLVVAGGGGGGSGANSGGGGAGGLRSTVTATGGGGSLESKLFLTQGTSYTAVVGSGGAGGASSGRHGTNGGNSFFGNIISYGGGGGAPPGNDEGYNNGLDGGSGGGGGLYGTKGGLGVSGQGFAGAGHPAWLSGSNLGGVNAGGGGGAGSVAATPTTTVPSSGGVGVQITALATPTGTGANSGYYAGGGAGNTNSYTPVGGLGGGGNMNTAGTANTGGGGGAGGNTGGILGGAGGSGVIIIRYLVA